ncbi:MAG TPA: hypothetical protein VHU89_08455 [Acidobacteriaceae bacterium]|jgi:hypothetical protein|nr:hypothetical protein [Acidobacteriaceae bacterium]
MKRYGRYAFQAILLAVVLDAFWIVCVAGFHSHELMVGLAATLLSVAFCLFTVRKLPLKFRPTLSEMAEIWRLPFNATVDVALVTWVLLQDLAGKRAPSLFRSTPWLQNADTGRGTARRVLATAYATVSPNLLVIGVDRERGQMLFHQIQADSVPRIIQRLGAGGAQ